MSREALLSGRRALVTGGTRDIGFTIAESLPATGAATHRGGGDP